MDEILMFLLFLKHYMQFYNVKIVYYEHCIKLFQLVIKRKVKYY